MATVGVYKQTVTRRDKKGKKYTTKSGCWRLKWQDAATGKRCTENTGTHDRSAARQIARAKETELALAARGLIDPTAQHDSMAWEDLTKRYLEHCKVTKRPGTRQIYGHSFDAFTRLSKPGKVRGVNSRTLIDFAAARMKEVSAVTVNRDLRSLRAVLRWGAACHFVRTVPSFRGIFVREDDKLPVVVPSADLGKVRAAFDDPELVLEKRPAAWWRVFFELAIYLGARRSEVLGITWGRLDLVQGEIKVVCTTSKSRRDRVLPLSSELVAILKTWHDAQPTKPAPADLILPWPHNGLRKFYYDWEAILAKAGVPHFLPKHCRSTCGSEMVRAGVATLTVRDWLGHQSVTTTEKHYLRTNTDTLRAAAEKRQKG